MEVWLRGGEHQGVGGCGGLVDGAEVRGWRGNGWRRRGGLGNTFTRNKNETCALLFYFYDSDTFYIFFFFREGGKSLVFFCFYIFFELIEIIYLLCCNTCGASN